MTGGNEEHKNGSLKVVDVSILSYFENIESYHSDMRGLFTIFPILSGVEGFLGRLICLFQISCMCLI